MLFFAETVLSLCIARPLWCASKARDDVTVVETLVAWVLVRNVQQKIQSGAQRSNCFVDVKETPWIHAKLTE